MVRVPGTREVAQAIVEAERGVSRGEGAAALSALAPLAPVREHDAGLARLWLAALRLAPDAASLAADLVAMAEAHAQDPRLAADCVATLVAAAKTARSETAHFDETLALYARLFAAA